MSVFKYKAFNERKDKILISVVTVFISLYMAFSCTYFTSAAQSVKNDVVRLHILANSDSKDDQEVKIKVRDALLNKNNALLSGDVTTENADVYFEENKEELLKTVMETLKENKFGYGAEITLAEEYYETRQYGDLTFPAGRYTSLKVILGDGEGRNWWCVMFPPLCVPAADDVSSDNLKTSEYLTESGEEIINGGKKYIVKFKLLEIYEELKELVH